MTHFLLWLAQAPAQPPPVVLPPTMTREQLLYLRDMAAVQVFTALVLQLQMVLAVLGTIAVAFAWRRTGLALFVLMGAAMAFVPSGYSFYYGVTVAFFAAGGLVWSLVRGRA